MYEKLVNEQGQGPQKSNPLIARNKGIEMAADSRAPGYTLESSSILLKNNMQRSYPIV